MISKFINLIIKYSDYTNYLESVNRCKINLDRIWMNNYYYVNVYLESREHLLKPTIKDVAKKADVSIATVSRVLNKLGGYSPETEVKVLQVIDEMNYTPNAIARGLVNQKTRTIGVLHPSMSGRFVVDLLRGVEDFTHSKNYSVVICNTDNDGKRTMEYIHLLGENQVEGIIFASEVMTEEYEKALIKLNIPVVLVSTVSYKKEFPLISVNNFTAAYDATVHLIKKGHKDILMVAGDAENEVAGIPREKGFRKALEDHKLRNDDSSVYYGDFSYKSGMNGIKELRKVRPEATAVFTASDLMALGILNYAYKFNVKVPEELAVMGFDDTEDALMAVPPLTTVHQPIEEMGRLAAQMILDNEVTFESRILAHHITERDTV